MSFFTGFILGVIGLLLLLVLVGILLGPRDEARAEDPPPEGQERVRHRRRAARSQAAFRAGRASDERRPGQARGRAQRRGRDGAITRAARARMTLLAEVPQTPAPI